MNRFFNSISQILNQPEDVSVRNQAMLEGQTLTQDITADVSTSGSRCVSDVNDQMQNMAGNINQLTAANQPI